MLTIRKYTINDALLAEAGFSVRRAVFVEEQNVLPDEEFEGEDESIHFLLFYREVPVATARWRLVDNAIKLERFAVLKEYRSQGFGTLILQAVLNDLKGRPENIYLHAQLSALSFYERAGFIRKGNIFSECDILHYKMVYKPGVTGSINEAVHKVYDYMSLSNQLVSQSPVLSPPQSEQFAKQLKNTISSYQNAVRNGDEEGVKRSLSEGLYVIFQAVNSHGMQEDLVIEFKKFHEEQMKGLSLKSLGEEMN